MSGILSHVLIDSGHRMQTWSQNCLHMFNMHVQLRSMCVGVNPDSIPDRMDRGKGILEKTTN